MPLRVLTLNIWNISGPYDLRRPLIRTWIELLQPDVIGFQEAVRRDGFDQIGELLEGAGYHYDYAVAAPAYFDASYEFGNAIASHWPILDREELRLPDSEDGETRSAISVTVEAPFGRLSITCTHLNWKAHHGSVRERQVVAVAEFARRRRPAGGYPPIVVGDFNAAPDSTEIRYMSGLHALDGNSAHFYDAFAVAGEGPGITWNNRNSYAREANEPGRRIDYIFVGGVSPGGLGKVEYCNVVCDESRGGAWPSDHFGVVADLHTPEAL